LRFYRRRGTGKCPDNDIERFTSSGGIDNIWCDRAHYLTPDDPVGEKAFAGMRDAMKATMVGLSRLFLQAPAPDRIRVCAPDW
jgi:non-homologous end joining protein Ku